MSIFLIQMMQNINQHEDLSNTIERVLKIQYSQVYNANKQTSIYDAFAIAFNGLKNQRKMCFLPIYSRIFKD